MLDSKMKKLLKNFSRQRNIDATDWLAQRQERAAHIASIADEEGKVCVLESGRDCDGVVYSGQKSIIPASIMAFERHENHVGEWADGPFHLQIIPTSDMAEIEYTSRDTFAEAMNY